ncbi:MucR family transcriptional regulator [Mesorhizobium sp. M1B.F.Ca.ET.045.04.1.1]|uniref:MucR family transcriptional regulator n=1 Tax=Mesorhizobium sp. M1B.F.Ca.ET.045.04.1.1 TaxID=2493673 RepID=UPI000F7542C8|nr:MucR family transcriptional regulator [Mesorhizobium sp. M1B.F.Ca.ET.045.04.1.1]AZO28658.1 transcriptional regulator [Mesorhizobium sp. M1B.F.Ca.ET.045.04.1.1]
MTEQNETQNVDLIGLTADIVSAYVAKNALPVTELPGLIASIHSSLSATTTQKAAEKPNQEPAVIPKRSVFPDYIICLEDGKKFKSLKRHLGVNYGLTPNEYREKWGLKPEYPMVAPNYAARRSALAKSSGLGRKRAAKPAKSTAKKRSSR